MIKAIEVSRKKVRKEKEKETGHEVLFDEI